MGLQTEKLPYLLHCWFNATYRMETTEFDFSTKRPYQSTIAFSEVHTYKQRTIFRERPMGLQHLLEDFTTEFSAIRSHTAPLRKFFEFFTETDLRPHLDEHCLEAMLTSHAFDPYSRLKNNLPLECAKLGQIEESVSLYS